MSIAVGIAGLGVYVPDTVMAAPELAERTGIPEAVIAEKFGLVEKRIAGPDEHVTELAVVAGRRALEAASERLGRRIAPTDVGGLLYFGSPHKEYPVWLAAPKIQRELGAPSAWAFEVGVVSAGAPVALRVAADMMAADPALDIVLIVAASRESELLDYDNDRSRFMFNFGDGAAAAVLCRGLDENVILRSAFITDSCFAEDVLVPAGGSKRPASSETVAEGLHAFTVTDPAAMKQRLDPVTLDRFVGVTRDAIRRSGRDPSELGFLATLHTKRSLYDAVLDGLGLDPEQSVYLDHYGHISAVDPLIGLWEGERRGLLRPGMLAVALSAGTGYSWTATALSWGRSDD